jgi:hypothetical protein
MNLVKEKLSVFTIENKHVVLIEDLEVLGIYTYMKMIMESGECGAHKIIEQIKEHFKIPDSDIIEHIRVLEQLGLMTMVKK